jgi:hypothetical protein
MSQRLNDETGKHPAPVPASSSLRLSLNEVGKAVTGRSRSPSSPRLPLLEGACASQSLLLGSSCLEMCFGRNGLESGQAASFSFFSVINFVLSFPPK